MNFTLLTFDSLDSTNTEALKHAKAGAPEGLCIVARQQTGGRGRHGRTWISEKDAGLYFSIILRPTIHGRFLPLITLASGIAVHETLAEYGLTPDIKWVNDVLVGEKKIAGILAETTDTNDGVAVIVGIGINLRSSNLAPETSTSIEASAQRSVTAAELAEKLTANLERFYQMLNAENGPRAIVDEWRRRSSYFVGKRVRVVTGNETIVGVTDGLEDNGALRIRCADDGIKVIQAGDVERLRAETD